MVAPHAQHFYRSFVFDAVIADRLGDHLVHEAVLDVDAPRVEAREVADERLVGGRGAEGVAPDHLDELLRLSVEARSLEAARVLRRLLREPDEVHGYHASSSSETHSSSGSFIPARRDSAMPGMLLR